MFSNGFVLGKNDGVNTLNLTNIKGVPLHVPFITMTSSKEILIDTSDDKKIIKYCLNCYKEKIKEYNIELEEQAVTLRKGLNDDFFVGYMVVKYQESHHLIYFKYFNNAKKPTVERCMISDNIFK